MGGQKYQNETATRQRRESVTVRYTRATNINTKMTRQERYRDNSAQGSRLLQVNAAVDTLDHQQGRYLTSHPLSGIFI